MVAGRSSTRHWANLHDGAALARPPTRTVAYVKGQDRASPGPNATITNSRPLIPSNKARMRAGLPPLTDLDGKASRYDALRPQRLAAPITVYVEHFSAHPLEAEPPPRRRGHRDPADACHVGPRGLIECDDVSGPMLTASKYGVAFARVDCASLTAFKMTIAHATLRS